LAADNPQVQVVAAWDRRGQNNSAYYWIQPDDNLFRLADYVEGENYWPQIELNTGDPENLVQFVQWAQERFPAQHYALILSDHGSGLGGGMMDDTSGKDLLTLKDMDNALNQITANGAHKIDVLYLDTCLMAMLEDIYQFRNYARYYVGSENLQWSWADPYYHYVADVTADSTPADVATIMTNAYADAGIARSGSFTISAVDLSHLSDVITATNQLAGELDEHMVTISNTLITIHLIVQKFEMNGDDIIDETDEYIDLFDFAFLVKGLTFDNDVKTAAQDLMDALDPFVIAERHGSAGAWDLEHSHGVSIFWPDQSSSFYNPDNYDFAAGADWGQLLFKNAIHRPGATGWGNLLVNYIQAVYPGSHDLSTPPEVQPRLDDGYSIYLPLTQR
jgi:hypothetical protein